MNAHILVAYFSWSGNTATLAKQIQEKAGGDLFEIKTVAAYPTEYNACTKQAQAEQRANARPPLAGSIPNMQQYDVVMVGYPNWWSSMPMPVWTFLESYDFAGKIVFPFCTHGGGGLGHSKRDLEALLSDSDVSAGFQISDSRISGAQPDLDRWLREAGFIH